MRISKILYAGTALLLAGALGGCSVRLGTSKKPDADAIIAEPTAGDADDGMKIAYGEFSKEYGYMLKGAGIEDDDAEDVAESCKAQRSTIITYLINERIIFKKAAEMGVSTLTEAEMNAVDEEYNSRVEEQIEAFGRSADFGTTAEEEITEEQRRERGSEEFDKYLVSCGMTRDDLLQWSVSSAITNKLIDEVGKSVEYSAAEESFAEYTEEVKRLYSESTAQYEHGGYTDIWVPEGSRMIKHILLGFDEDVQIEITDKRKNGDDAAADKLREEKAAELRQQTDEVQKKLDDGEDFKTIMLEYSGDAAGSSLQPDGYVVVPNGVMYMKEFQEAAFAIEKIGDRTVCVTDYGVHVMIYADDAKVSEDTKKSYIDYIYEQMKNTEFSKRMDEWRAEYDYRIDYEALGLDDPADSSSAAQD